jgi:hypothetical protein
MRPDPQLGADPVRSWRAPVRPFNDEWTATVERIISQGMWCVLEACTDVAAQSWEPVLLVCSTEEEMVSGALVTWIGDFPSQDLRLCGYTRDTLRRVDQGPSVLCYLAPA